MDEIIPRAWKEIAKPAAIALGIATIIWFFFIYRYLPWGLAVFAALMSTPLLTALWFRIRAFKRIGFRMLPNSEAIRLYGWTLVTLVSVHMLICSLEYWRGRSAYASLKRELERKGGSLSLESVIPPPVPDEQNFCAIPLLQSQVRFAGEVTLFNRRKPVASPQHERVRKLALPNYEGEWMFAKIANLDPVRNAMSTNRFETVVESDSAARTILRYCESQTALTELRQAMSRPHTRWNLPYESGWFVDMAANSRNHALWVITKTLRLRALAALAEEQPNLALENVLVSLRLSDSLQGEPSPFAFDKRHQLLGWTLAPVWEGLARRAWSEDHLSQMQKRLNGLDLIAEGREQDRITAIVWMSFWRDARRTLTIGNLFRHWSELQNDPGEAIGMTLAWVGRPSGWDYLNMVNTYRWLDPDREPDFFALPNDPVACIFFVPKFEALIAYREEHRPLLHLAYLQARVACALERYWLQHETYPESLETLVPQWIDELPALSYRRTPNRRYLLHSPERKTVPDEYQPLEHRSERRTAELGDSVWRYPTTAPPAD
ncbi:MAG: hypothetical protein ACPGVU_04490 [Limisphaerales bacterium]